MYAIHQPAAFGFRSSTLVTCCHAVPLPQNRCAREKLRRFRVISRLKARQPAQQRSAVLPLANDGYKAVLPDWGNVFRCCERTWLPDTHCNLHHCPVSIT